MDRPSQPPPSGFFPVGDLRFPTPLSPPWIMGIVNVTPDSFSDGGEFLDPAAAVDRALQQIKEGAKIIDIGGESTRPGSLPVPPREQLRRVLPVIERLRAQDQKVLISIDTTSAEVARAALAAGANMVNDTSAMRDDPAMVDAVAENRVSIVLMHRKGTPRDMQEGGGPQYADVVGEVLGFLEERTEFARQRGVDGERIVVDPGIGFGKRTADNLMIIQQIRRFVSLGFPVLIGVSRKRFIGEILGLSEPRDRLTGSIAVAVLAAQNGASMIRAHDVGPTVQAIRMVDATLEHPV